MIEALVALFQLFRALKPESLVQTSAQGNIKFMSIADSWLKISIQVIVTGHYCVNVLFLEEMANSVQRIAKVRKSTNAESSLSTMPDSDEETARDRRQGTNPARAKMLE